MILSRPLVTIRLILSVVRVFVCNVGAMCLNAWRDPVGYWYRSYHRTATSY